MNGMKSRVLSGGVIGWALGSCLSANVAAQTGDLKTDQLVASSTAVIERQLGESENRRIPADLRSQAKCIAVFPAVVKVGLIVAGKRGNGLISCRHPQTKSWGTPAIFNITAASVGIQAGIQSASYVFLFLNKKSADGLLKEKIKFGSDFSVAAGPVGGGANLDTQPAVVSYVRTEGLFAGVDLEGAALTFNEASNAEVYGWDADAQHLLSGEQPLTETFRSYVDALMKFAP